jgi:taurine dioxygenase
MPDIAVRDLQDDLPFGARVAGVTMASLIDPDVRSLLNATFLDRGMIVFEDIEPSAEMQLELSRVFGPLVEHAIKQRPNMDEHTPPGLIDLNFEPDDTDIFEVDGKQLASYLPWHFDACYMRELNRGGILRALVIPPTGGLTGFADGIQIYEAVDPELRDRFEDLDILYHSSLVYTRMRFGQPPGYRQIKLRQEIVDMFDRIKHAPRAVHPAIWQRETGEKVLHVSSWQAVGIDGHENAEGDALLAELIAEMAAKMKPYRHAWKPTDMVIWDNWRFLHSVSGHDPHHARRVQRTTIQGDYGLGRLDGNVEEVASATAMI